MPGIKYKAYWLAALLAMLISACNYPGRATPPPSGPALIYTAAAQTLQAQMTQVNQPPATQAFPSPFPSATVPVVVASPTVVPAASPFPASSATIPPSPTPVPCDQAEFVKDVTYPDDSKVAPGEVFVKTWRIRNSGSCTWNTGYALVYTGGAALGAPAAVPLTANVPPGSTVDLSATLTAPVDGGTYRAEFKLRNASNVVFGLGSANKAFWVQVIVPVRTGVLLDFVSDADIATWLSSSATEPGVALTFGGADDDPAGAASIKDGVKLETGATSGKLLFTYPRRVDNGAVSGVFPEYEVQNGDRFKARLGFLLPSGSTACGSGKVKFQLLYRVGTGELKLLAEWAKSCNGSLLPVDVDLSALKGKKVFFSLAVLANGPATDDWAIWNSPRIEHP